MKKFLLLLHQDKEAMRQLSATEMKIFLKFQFIWASKLKEKGFFVSGDTLDEAGLQIIDTDCSIEYGPYILANEYIGGYYLLQAPNMNEILEIAKECPCHLWGGVTEIRPMVEHENM